MITGAVLVSLLAVSAGTGVAESAGVGAGAGSGAVAGAGAGAGATVLRRGRGADSVRGGEARDALRLSVTTNGAAAPPRVRAGTELLRVYQLANRAEYPLTGVTLDDPQLQGVRPDCGRPLPLVLRGLETVECRARLSAAPGDQAVTVTADAQAPAGLPNPAAGAPASYHGVVSGLRVERVADAPRAAWGGPPGGSVPGSRTDAASADATAGVVGAAGRSLRRSAWRPALVDRAAADLGLAPAAPEADPPLRLRFSLLALGEVPLSGVGMTDSVPGITAVDCPGLANGGVLAPGNSVECTAAGQALPGRQSGIARAAATAADHTVGEDGRELPALTLNAEANSGYDGPAPPPTPVPGTGGSAGSGTGDGSSTGSGGTGGSSGSSTGGGVAGSVGPGSGAGGASGVPGAGPGGGPGGSTLASGSVPAGTAATATAPLFGRVPASAFAAGGTSATSAAAAVAAAAAAAAAGAGPGPAGTTGAVGAAGSAANTVNAANGVGAAGGVVGGALAGGAAAAAAAGLAAVPVAAGAQLGVLQGAPYLPGLTPGLPATPFRAGTPQGNRPGGAAGTAAPGRALSPGAAASPLDQLSGGRRREQPYTISDDWGPTEVMWLLLAFLLPVICVLAAAFAGRVKRRT
ncbi:hypothetical protein [Kitasatospora viridis]|uniref:Uncharacterized protein n=1 Tax=Kitasatospora viridis TaxID=281105 RepID=A0A561UKU7_9ACTN|nr:hypothetical protein [Kitasatospora viridis]TWF99966.1 hypothetical protein FHX73_113827 [Kitasatospora viridis]